MSEADDLVAEFEAQERYRKLLEPVPGSPYGIPPQTPQGWKPGVELNGREGTITSRATTEPKPQWDDLLRSWGFDPALYEVVDPVQVATWDGYIKGPDGTIHTRQLWSHKARIRARSSDDADVAALVREIRRRKPRRSEAASGQGATFVLNLADMQIGKGEGGGTQATVERVLGCIDKARARLKHLRKIGYVINEVAILNGGDSIENACGWYPHQLYSIDLNVRDQKKVATRLFGQGIEAFADVVPRVTFATSDSNHGENRDDGKVRTDDADSADLEIAERLAESYGRSDAFSHVRFVVPNDAAVTMLDLSGVPLALAHGHRAPSSTTAAQKQQEWWKGQAFGNQDAGAARILWTAHFHHFSCLVDYGRTWIQSTALDGGSAYLTKKTGKHSPPGAVSCLVGEGLNALGWAELEVLWA